MAQQLRFLFTASADIDKAPLGARAHREHILGGDEDANFADGQLVASALDHLQHDEQRAIVFVDFGALMTMLRVFHREIMQTELALHRLKFFGLRVLERDPDKTVGSGSVRMNFAYGSAGEPAAILIGDTVDEHRMPRYIACTLASL